MRARKLSLLIFSLSVVFALNACSKRENFKIRDYVVDSTAKGKFVTMFVETKLKDSLKIVDYAKSLQQNPIYAKTDSAASLCVFKILFFNPGDAVRISPSVLKNIFIRMDSAHVVELSQKTRFVANAFTYIGFNGDSTGITIPRSQLTRNDIFVPDEGAKASEIIKLINK